ncbi:MAG: type VI secretion system baseplate subunit TssK [Planctomycetota bacterium]|nr:type VI secretion system baseplate subunit TssK [Planctomycetota bacterium]
MTGNDRVVWDEGMLLVPQHFQQWSRFLEGEMRRRAAIASPFFFGLSAIEVDDTAIESGEFALHRLAGVLPNGFLFESPNPDPLPPARRFAEAFDARAESLAVYLAIPTLRSGGAAISDDGIDGDRPTPFLRRIRRVVDEARPGVERPISTALPNLRLVFGGEVLDDYECMQIAEIERSATGTYRLSDTFVPTCLRLSASPILMAVLRRNLEVLSARSEELGSRSRQTSGMAGAANLWLLDALNASLPVLQHLYQHPAAHPQELYMHLATLAGRMCTLATDQHPRKLPAYDHLSLTETFQKIDASLRSLLETVVPNRCVAVPLNRESETAFQARLPDTTLLEQAQFFLGVSSDLPEQRLVAEFPMKVKISSIDRVQQLLVQMVPGLTIQHVPVLPEEIPARAGASYFRLEPTGDHWDAITQSHSFAFHVPPDIEGVQLELVAIKDD